MCFQAELLVDLTIRNTFFFPPVLALGSATEGLEFVPLLGIVGRSFDWTGNYGLFGGWYWRFNWLPCMLAWWGSLRLSGYDAFKVIKPKGAPGGKHGQTKYETSPSPLFVFLVSKRSLLRFWGCLVWHLWIGEAQHPGPGDGTIGVEVFNVGGWLTHGDIALETGVGFFGCG